MSVFVEKKCVPSNAARGLWSSDGSLDCPVLVHDGCTDPLGTFFIIVVSVGPMVAIQMA